VVQLVLAGASYRGDGRRGGVKVVQHGPRHHAEGVGG
jgi:hypothetical protein